MRASHREIVGRMRGTSGPSFEDYYFKEPDTVVNVVDRLVPTAVTAVMMTTAMSAAIKPYSIAVAPLSLSKKRTSAFMSIS